MGSVLRVPVAVVSCVTHVQAGIGLTQTPTLISACTTATQYISEAKYSCRMWHHYPTLACLDGGCCFCDSRVVQRRTAQQQFEIGLLTWLGH
jgi:hypothetical protein